MDLIDRVIVFFVFILNDVSLSAHMVATLDLTTKIKRLMYSWKNLAYTTMRLIILIHDGWRLWVWRFIVISSDKDWHRRSFPYIYIFIVAILNSKPNSDMQKKKRRSAHSRRGPFSPSSAASGDLQLAVVFTRTAYISKGCSKFSLSQIILVRSVCFSTRLAS